MLHDYVPFYFGERSPMLLANHRRTVPSNPTGPRALIYLVSSVERAQSCGAAWVFTDGHAVIRFTRYFEDLQQLSALDWETIHAQRWHDTPEDPDRKRRKQAEFLIHRFAPLSLITELAVLDAELQARVLQILSDAGVSLPVLVRPEWYYHD